MNNVFQWIIVGLIVLGAVVYFVTRKKGKDCCDCPYGKDCRKRKTK